MKTSKVWMMLVLLAGLLPLSAQTPAAPEQLTGLIRKAIENYPKMKEGSEMVKLSEARKELAYGAYMPVISGEASYRYQQPTPEISIPIPGFESKIKFMPANNYDMALKLTQPITDFGRTQATINKSKVDIQNSKDNLESAQNALAYQVAQIYYGIVFLNKSLDVQQEQINLLGENEKLIQNKIKNGDGLQFDLLSTQVKKNMAQNRLIDLQTQLQKQYQVLNMLTGDSGTNYITVKDVDPKQFAAANVTPEENYDIKLLQNKLSSAAWDIKLAKRGWLPSLLLQAQAGYKNGFVPDIDKLQFNYGVGVGLNVPIFSSARPNYQTKIAKIGLQANTYALESQKLMLNKDIVNAQSDMNATEQKLNNYELQVQQANEALKLANTRYKGGVITNLELLMAQTNLQDAQLGKIQLEYNLLLSKLELNRLGSVKFW